MPILQGSPGIAGIIAGLLSGGGQVYGAMQQAKMNRAELERKQAAQDQALAYQKWLMQHGDTDDAIKANAAGMVFDPVAHSVAPWKPPTAIPGMPDAGAPANPVGDGSPATLGNSATPVAPGLSSMLGSPSPPAMASPGVGTTPTVAAGGNAPGQPSQPAQPTSLANPQPNQRQVSPDLVQASALAQAQVGSLMGVYQSELKQVETLSAQNAPAVIIERHRKNAQQALTEAGVWMGRHQAAEAAINTAQRGAAEDAEKLRLQSFRQGLKLPPGFAKLPPEKQIGYLNNRLQAATSIGDDQTIKATVAQIERLQSGQTITETGRHNKVGEGQRDQSIGIERRNSDINAGQLDVSRGNLGIRREEFNAQFGTTPTPAMQAVWQRLQGTNDPAQRYAIIGDPNNGLTVKHRNELGGFVGNVASANNASAATMPTSSDIAKSITTALTSASFSTNRNLAAIADTVPFRTELTKFANLDESGREAFLNNPGLDPKIKEGLQFVRPQLTQNQPLQRRVQTNASPPSAAPRTTAKPAASGGGQPKTKVNPANGKTYYLHADGNFYLTP